MSYIKDNLRRVQGIIAESAADIGREPAGITLLAVTKTFPHELVNEALNCGITAIGENRVQEAAGKFPFLTGRPEKHLIGPLQTNKVNKALTLFDWIQSLDNVKLAKKLDQAAGKLGRGVNVLVEVKLEDEPNKHGLDRHKLRPFLEETASLGNLKIQGLMAIPPFKSNPEEVRPYFKQLRKLFETVPGWDLPNVRMRYLSMGMSHDFGVAIQEGSNMIRIGSALFGERRIR